MGTGGGGGRREERRKSGEVKEEKWNGKKRWMKWKSGIGWVEK